VTVYAAQLVNFLNFSISDFIIKIQTHMQIYWIGSAFLFIMFTDHLRRSDLI